MPFPQFDYCLICDGIRPELGGKLTILGFYGASPNVEVVVGNPNQPLVLAFVAGFPPVPEPEAIYQHVTSVIRPDGALAFQTPTTKLNVSASGRGIVGGGFGLQPPFIWGRHSIRINVNQELKLDATFNIRSATQTELGLSGIIIPPGGRPN